MELRLATLEATYSDILIGPLPIQVRTTAWQPLKYTTTRKTEGSARDLDARSDTPHEWILNITGSDNDTLDVWCIGPLWQDEDGGDKAKLTCWATFWNQPTDPFDVGTLPPLGLSLKFHDPPKWKQEGWLYIDNFYPTAETLKDAFYSAAFLKLGANVEGVWGTTDQQGEVPPLDAASPSALTAPGGSRYSVDAESKYIEWMDFSFYIAFTRDRGLNLMDIRCKCERILYELGLQEALAHYAGNDPVQSGTGYLDSY